VALGNWTQGLAVAMQAFYHLGLAPSPFCFSYFWYRVSHFCLGSAWTAILPFMPPVKCSWDYRQVPPCPAEEWFFRLISYSVGEIGTLKRLWKAMYNTVWYCIIKCSFMQVVTVFSNLRYRMEGVAQVIRVPALQVQNPVFKP
jgi:hypothetical protein